MLGSANGIRKGEVIASPQKNVEFEGLCSRDEASHGLDMDGDGKTETKELVGIRH